jgi:hypothetical protein
MDNAPYHSMQICKIPWKYSVNTEIWAWLHKKGISCDMNMHKQEQFSPTATNKSRQKLSKQTPCWPLLVILSLTSHCVCVTLVPLNWQGPSEKLARANRGWLFTAQISWKAQLHLQGINSRSSDNDLVRMASNINFLLMRACMYVYVYIYIYIYIYLSHGMISTMLHTVKGFQLVNRQ